MTALRVEPAAPADLPRIAELAAFSLVEAWSADGFAGQLGQSFTVALVARAAQGIVGYLVAHRVEGELHVLSLAVDPVARRRGIASALLRAALEPTLRATLEVRSSSQPAQALYRRFGFREVGRRRRYYADGEDALLMTRECDAEPDTGTPTALPLRAHARVLENARATGGLRLRLGLDAWPGSAPGQFVMLSPGALAAVARFDPLLPRPMAVYRESRGNGGHTIDILYKVSGRGTALLSVAAPGDAISLVGPLGRGFPAPAPEQEALLVGGGTGIASLYELAARARERAPLRVLLGARREADLLGVEDFEALGVPLELATEDGSRGRRGLVTALLEEALARSPSAAVYACGPTPMMRRAAELAGSAGRPCHVSLENTMACGFGVCLGCAAPRPDGGVSLVCRDGPVLDASSVAWAALA